MCHIKNCQQEKFLFTDAKKVFKDQIRFEIFFKDIKAGIEVVILLEKRQ